MNKFTAMIAVVTVFASTAANASSADKRSFPAKGTKTCMVFQFSSKYLAAHGDSSGRTLPRVLVARDGTVSMGISKDKYPGSKVYFLIGQKRYSGTAGSLVKIDSAGLLALKRDDVIQFTYTTWPYKHDRNGADVLEGFDASYTDCLAFLR